MKDVSKQVYKKGERRKKLIYRSTKGKKGDRKEGRRKEKSERIIEEKKVADNEIKINEK